MISGLLAGQRLGKFGMVLSSNWGDKSSSGGALKRFQCSDDKKRGALCYVVVSFC
jgi:hypothetical protein